MRIYIDADILIHHLRGNRLALNFLQKIDHDQSKNELWICAMQKAEIVFFMRENEVALVHLLLSKFRCAPVTDRIIDEAGKLFRTWHKSHGIDPNDAILAATVQSTGGVIYTLNVKHYPMHNIVVKQAWDPGSSKIKK